MRKQPPSLTTAILLIVGIVILTASVSPAGADDGFAQLSTGRETLWEEVEDKSCPGREKRSTERKSRPRGRSESVEGSAGCPPGLLKKWKKWPGRGRGRGPWPWATVCGREATSTTTPSGSTTSAPGTVTVGRGEPSSTGTTMGLPDGMDVTRAGSRGPNGINGTIVPERRGQNGENETRIVDSPSGGMNVTTGEPRGTVGENGTRGRSPDTRGESGGGPSREPGWETGNAGEAAPTRGSGGSAPEDWEETGGGRKVDGGSVRVKTAAA